MGSDLRWAAPISSVKGRFGGRRPHRQSMTSRFCSPLIPVVAAIVGGGDVTGLGVAVPRAAGNLCPATLH